MAEDTTPRMHKLDDEDDNDDVRLGVSDEKPHMHPKSCVERSSL